MRLAACPSLLVIIFELPFHDFPLVEELSTRGHDKMSDRIVSRWINLQAVELANEL